MKYTIPNALSDNNALSILIGVVICLLIVVYALFFRTAYAAHTFTFTFNTSTESWNFTSDNGTCTGTFTSNTGNPAGSLQTTGTKSGGGQACNTYWEWQGTWESLGVPAGHEVSGITGSYEYAVSNDGSNGTWSTGALELRDNSGTIRNTLVPALTGQTGTAGFTTRTNAQQTFTEEASNTPIRLRINTGVSFGGGNRTWTGQIDNISLTIQHQPVVPPPPPPQDMYQAGFFQGTELVSGQTNLNVATQTALVWNTATAYDNNFLDYDNLNPSRISIIEAGDYFLNLTIPITSSCTINNQRNAIQAEVHLNGTKQDIGVGRSSFIRNISGHCESSLHLNGMLPNLEANDYLEISIIRTTTNSTNTLTSNTHSLYLEYVSNKSVFQAKATQTSAANLNQPLDALSWNPVRSDTPFSYNATPRTISLNEGLYALSVSIPIQGGIVRGNILGRIRINGNTIDGGTFNQGYIRNADGHTQSSIHWTGVIQASPGDELDITVEGDAAAGTITTGGEKASLYLQKISTNGLLLTTGNLVGSENNLNPPIKSQINWNPPQIRDIAYYNPLNSQSVEILKDGDYHINLNASYASTDIRVNPKITIQVNGVDIQGAEAKTGYIRSTSGHNRASNSLHHILRNLTEGDVITVSKQAEAATGTVTAPTPMRIALRKLDTIPPFITQIGYRFYENQNSTDVGEPLTNQNIDLPLDETNTPIRLRILLRTDVTDIPQNSTFQLEVAPETSSCSPNDTFYQPVTTSTPIAFYSNPNMTDGEALLPNDNDPVDGTRTIQSQTYNEANPLSNTLSSIPNGDTGMWDISLIDNTSNTSTYYCLRLTDMNGDDLDNYSLFPRIRTAPSEVIPSFPFDTDTEGWSFTSDNFICSGEHNTISGNPAGSLEITGSKNGGGGQTCNTYWEWQGTWEELGVPINSTITGIQGSYQYSVTTDNSGGSWTTGSLSLRDSFGILQETLVPALQNQTETIAFTTQTGPSILLTEASSTPIRLRIETSIDFGGGNANWTGLIDSIQLEIEYDSTTTFNTLSLALSESAVGFGELTPDFTRYATRDGLGNSTPTLAHSITSQSNALNGYEVLFQGTTLQCTICESQNTIAPILTNPAPAITGTEQFGLNASTISGTATIEEGYDTNDWLFSNNNDFTLLYTGNGDNIISEVGLQYMANIAPETEAGDYETTLTFIIVGHY